MESNESALDNSTPNLSQYFADDPPSVFDEFVDDISRGLLRNLNNQAHEENFRAYQLPIMNADGAAPTVSKTPKSSITAETFSGTFKANDYIENVKELEEDSKISDDVRNFWIKPTPNTTLLTLPGIQTPNDLPDLIATAVCEHFGEIELKQRKMLTADSVTQDVRGLRSLIAAGCYRAAVNLTGRLLTIYGQGYNRTSQPTCVKHSPHSLQLWFTRLALLAKLGEYSLLQQESEPFSQLERPDVYYALYPEMYPGKTGSMASFSFRLLLAEIPIYMGNTATALNRLTHLLDVCDSIYDLFKVLKIEGKITIEEVEFWRRRQQRVWHSIINCNLIMKNYDVIDNYFDTYAKSGMCSSVTKTERRALYSAWGRIYLQIGDILGAEQKFAESQRLLPTNCQPDLRDLVDKGLIMVAKNDFQEAFTTFQRALNLDPGNIMILNNMGVCLLYSGKLKEAINIYESAINLNPQKALNESLLVNLSTLYELESNNSKFKKLNLLRLINIHKPDLSINIDVCLKLQTGK